MSLTEDTIRIIYSKILMYSLPTLNPSGCVRNKKNVSDLDWLDSGLFSDLLYDELKLYPFHVFPKWITFNLFNPGILASFIHLKLCEKNEFATAHWAYYFCLTTISPISFARRVHTFFYFCRQTEPGPKYAVHYRHYTGTYASFPLREHAQKSGHDADAA